MCGARGKPEMYTKIWWGKNETKRPLGRSRRMCKDNIRTYLKERGWEGVDWIHLVQKRDQWRVLVNAVMNLRVPCKVKNFLAISFLRRTAPWT